MVEVSTPSNVAGDPMYSTNFENSFKEGTSVATPKLVEGKSPKQKGKGTSKRSPQGSSRHYDMPAG